MATKLDIRGSYQEALRAVGAWLDIRGYGDVRIVEEEGVLVIRANARQETVEEIRLDRERLTRLCAAAKQDRGSALSRPVPGGPQPKAAAS